MVTILPRHEGFGAAFGKALGGVAKSAAEGYTERQQKKAKQKELMDLFNSIEGKGSQSQGEALKGQMPNPQEIQQKFLQSLPMFEQMKGSELTPQDADEIWKNMFEPQLKQSQPEQQQQQQMQSQNQEQDPFLKAKKALVGNQPDLAKIYTQEGKLASQQRFSREQAAEKSIEEIQDRLQGTELSDMRQEKLQNLFSEEKENQFPPSILAAAFTKDGEINPIGLSQLSPDAQEAVKLLADEVRGVKDTFGSQISGFEVRRWLARLPSLLNTPEGKRRVINDLRMMNKFSMDADQGVLDIIDRYGGPGEISISKAKNIYKKENAQKIKEMRQAFINPESAQFSDLPNASMFSGREIEDEETGQVFKSNGKEWIPQ